MMTAREAKNEDILRQVEKDAPKYCKDQGCTIYSYTDWYDGGGGRDACRDIPACSELPEGCDPEICSLRRLHITAIELENIRHEIKEVIMCLPPIDISSMDVFSHPSIYLLDILTKIDKFLEV